MVLFIFYYQVCSGLVLVSSLSFHLLHFFAVTLPMPAPEVLGAMIKDELMEYLEILITNLVPALGFSLVIRKITS
jgi:mannose/fructose/N-acetylgalactosamine-specific phosphotransferase system component IIC